jgi:hypothetical protein
VYCKILEKLHLAIQNKRRGMLKSSVVLLQDVYSHTAACTRALLEHLNWELSDYTPYKPDLAPRDYHMFTYLKNWLQSQHFNNNEELMEGVKNVAELTGGRLL